MNASTTTRSARRLALSLAVAGIAAFGSVAVAPAAFAASNVDGPATLLPGPGNGPDQFIVTPTGRIPVFFCEDVKPGKDGAQDPKDVAKAEQKAAKEDQKAADEAAKADDKPAKADDKADKVDRVMKQHNICIDVSSTGSRF